jgi:hypothetical protein
MLIYTRVRLINFATLFFGNDIVVNKATVAVTAMSIQSFLCVVVW